MTEICIIILPPGPFLVNVNGKVIFRMLPEVSFVLGEASNLTLLAFLLFLCSFVMIISALFCLQFEQFFVLLPALFSPFSSFPIAVCIQRPLPMMPTLNFAKCTTFSGVYFIKGEHL